MITKTEALSWKDEKDRKVITSFLNEQGISVQDGGEYSVDLEGTDGNYYEIENVSYHAPTKFLKEGRFRIPYRKAHYWNGKDSYENVHYFQFSNKSHDEFLCYPSSLIKKYINNVVELTHLKYKGWDLTQRKFISIPFDEGKDAIRRYVKKDNKFERVTIF